MDSTIIAAIIGALSTVGAAIGTLLITRIFDNVSLSPKNVRQISLTGQWEGTIHREGGGTPGVSLDMRFTATFKSTRTMRGEGSLSFTYQNQDITQHMTTAGKFVYDRFLKLEYEMDQPGFIQFGFAVLELSPDGQTLDGHFVGFAAISRNMVWGTVQGCKRGTTPYISAPAQTSKSN